MRRELTWQAVISAVIVAALISASYPYVLLKLGIGPNVSVVSAFLGAALLLALAPRSHGQNRLMNNIVQTAGTSASMTAFMCVIAAAVDLTVQSANTSGYLDGITHIDPWPMFFWLSCAGGIGVLFTALFRRHFLDDPKMVFADGVAAAEAIVVLDSRGREVRGKLLALSLAAVVSALVTWLGHGPGLLGNYFFSSVLQRFRAGIEWSLMSVGTGLLVGINVSLSLLVGTCIFVAGGAYLMDQGVGREIMLAETTSANRAEAERIIDRKAHPGKDGLSPAAMGASTVGLGASPWGAAPYAINAALITGGTGDEAFLKGQNLRSAAAYVAGNYYPTLVLWFMWPATGMMIASAVTAVLLKCRSVVESFTQLRARGAQHGREDISLKTVVIGSVLLAVALAVIQETNFGLSYLQTAVAVICALPLILVGIRVLGETNFGPISIMMNGLQAIFAVFWPIHMGHNLIAAGTAGTCNAQGEGTIQDYKTGQIVGSTPRVLTWVQLAAVPIGAAAVAIMYPLLVNQYGTPGSPGATLPAPTAIKISNMAVLMARGVDALPAGALLWTVIASAAGVLLVLAQHYFRVGWLPSATGLGLGLLLPGLSVVPIAIGGILGWVWEKVDRPSWDRYGITVASGLIAGEALLAGLFIPAYEALKTLQ